MCVHDLIDVACSIQYRLIFVDFIYSMNLMCVTMVESIVEGGPH